MPASTEPNSGLKYGWALGEDGWKDEMDANLLALGEVLTHAAVLSALDTPPGSPSDGDRHLVIGTATGDWTGHEDEIAVYRGADWEFHTPTAGWRVYNADAGRFLLYTGAAWAPLGVGPLSPVEDSNSSRTLDLDDAFRTILRTNSTGGSTTVPPSSSVDFPRGTRIRVVRAGTGAMSIAAGSGVTILSEDNMLDISAQYAAVELEKVDTDTWLLTGSLASA